MKKQASTSQAARKGYMIALFHEYKTTMHVDHTGEQKQSGGYFTFKILCTS